MAIYTTFFTTTPTRLIDGFPGWKLPLDEPVEREITGYFGEKEVIETREPLWDGVDPNEIPTFEYGVVAIEGDYAKYLEQRIPRFVQESAHWCSKGLTEVEIGPLGEIIDGKPALEKALFSHPALNAHLDVFREQIRQAIREDTQLIAEQWAERMSTPDFTHSADGSRRLQPDWTIDDARSILDQLLSLLQPEQTDHRLYLLTEW